MKTLLPLIFAIMFFPAYAASTPQQAGAGNKPKREAPPSAPLRKSKNTHTEVASKTPAAAISSAPADTPPENTASRACATPDHLADENKASTAPDNPSAANKGKFPPPPMNISEEAVALYHKATEQNDHDAQLLLGVMYARGHNVPQDDSTAVEWYRNSAEQGNAKAQHLLGMTYLNGRGVPYDYMLAVKWLNKASEQDQKTLLSHRESLKRAISFR